MTASWSPNRPEGGVRRAGVQRDMPDLSLEQAILRRGVRLVAGADEAGRGPLGPGPSLPGRLFFPPTLPEKRTGSACWMTRSD